MTNEMRQHALKLLALKMPDYIEKDASPCACGKCPYALKQTKVEEDRIIEYDGPLERSTSLCAVAGYECGVCRKVHPRRSRVVMPMRGER
jgi:hypothetical protein